MARKKIGKILSGGAIVLCVVLFSMLNTNVQAFEAQKVTFTISGSTGTVGGVTLKGLKDATGLPVTSDSSGFFSATVDYGWTGTVTPEKEGYNFNPPSKTYPTVTDNLTEEQFIPTQITYTVSGKVTMDGAGVEGVQLSGLLGDPVTGSDGTYTTTVPYGWDGTIIPVKEGFDFKPPSVQYPPLHMDKRNADFMAEPKLILIIGSIGEQGVTMEGLPNNPQTDEQGNYSAKVPYNWHGTVTPKKDGYEFNPPYIDYPNLTEDQTRQDYSPTALTFTIAGNAEVDGVEMKGLVDISGQPVITDMSGYYTATVKFGFTGTVEPTKPGYTFITASRTYAQVKSDKLEENYKATLKKMTISGKISGAQDVELQGLPGVIIGKDGTYTATVDYGWQGMVIPMKEGYDFKPENKTYPSVTSDMENQNYVAAKKNFTISGSTTVPGVQVKISSGRTVTSGPDATYTATVEYDWSGTITPTKPGYEFDPSSLNLQNVMSSVTNQSFVATLQKMTISGKITDEKGQPVPDIYVQAEPDGITKTTDINGEYSIEVDYQWRGKITPKRDGYTFKMPSKQYPSGIIRDLPNQNFTAIIQMFTIRDSVVIGNTPVQNVTITATDNEGKVIDTTKTDARGQFTLKVPYGWSGDITPTKAGLIFNPPSRPYSDVTTNMKDGAPEIITPPPSPTTTTEPSRIPTPRETTTAPPAGIPTPTETAPAGIPTPTETAPPAGIPTPTETAPPAGIPTPTETTPTTSVPSGYPTRPSTPVAGGGLISNSFSDDDLVTTVIPALSIASGKTIIAEDAVQGLISCNLNNVTLETALDIVLAGTPYIYKETPYYVLICSGGVTDAKFPIVSETKRMRLNYITAEAAVGLLSNAFTSYVKAETGPAGTDTYTVVVTAPPSIKDRIIEDLRKIDRPPAQVLLDARIVVMEKGDLLNLGVQWGWPTLRAGVFGGDNYGSGDTDFDFSGNWPWGVQIGYSPDNTFTNALEMTLNLLIENSEASIMAKPQVMAKDGKMSSIHVTQEEYYMLTPPTSLGAYAYTRAELQQIESGTKLEITPHVGDNNDITLQISVEVSDSIPRGRGSDLPVVTRRIADNFITIKDGGTVALAGLSENRTRSNRQRVPGLSRLPVVGELFKNSDDDNSSREIAVFITAHLVPQNGNGQTTTMQSSEPMTPIQSPSTAPMGSDFREDLRRSLSRPVR